MARDGFTCIHCGIIFQWQPGSDLHCGDDCAKEYAMKIEAAKNQLLDLGFLPYTAAPNIWVKDYVAITIEQILSEGLEATLASHAMAVQQHKARTQA